MLSQQRSSLAPEEQRANARMILQNALKTLRDYTRPLPLSLEALLAVFGRVCRIHSVAQIWVLRLNVVSHNQTNFVVSECIYPDSPEEKSRFVGRSLADINSDKSIVHVHVPYPSCSGRLFPESDICLIALPLCSLQTKQVTWVIKHLLNLLTDLTAQGMKEWPEQHARKILASTTFRKRGADNILIIDTMTLCRKIAKAGSATFWRLSRTRQTLDKVAHYSAPELAVEHSRSDGVQNIPIDDFYQVFEARKKEETRRTVADCVIVSTERGDVPMMRFIMERLSDKLERERRDTKAFQTDRPRLKPASYMRFRVATAQAPHGQVATAHFAANMHPHTRKNMARLTSSLLTGAHIPSDYVAIAIPFFGAKMLPSKELQKIQQLMRRDLTHAADLPFTGLLVLVVPKKDISVQRIELIKLILDRIVYILDAYSHQRLQFRLFNNVIEAIIASKDDASLLAAIEKAATQVFGAKGIVAWTAPAVGGKLLYKTETFSNANVTEVEAKAYLSLVNANGWFRFRSLCDVPHFLRSILEKVLDSRDEQLKSGLKNGISGYSFNAQIAAGTACVNILRDRPVKPSTWEQSALKALSLLANMRAGQITAEPQDEAYQAAGLGNLSRSQIADNGSLDIMKALDLVMDCCGCVGYLLFSYDADARYLCLERALHHRSKAIELGSHLPIDGMTLASLAVSNNTPLFGRKTKDGIEICSQESNQVTAIVPFMGWLPGSKTFIGMPLFLDEDTSFVLVAGFAGKSINRLISAKAPLVSRLAREFLRQLSFNRALERVRLRDEASMAERSIAGLPTPSVDLPAPAEDMPADVAAVFQTDFCKALDRLFEIYAKHFGWLSVSLRVANWFETELCRVAGTGPVGFHTKHSLSNKESTITYCYKYGSVHKAISIPDIGMLKSLQSVYPDLKYTASRSGVKSEICFPVRDKHNKVIGTLNIESEMQRAFAATRWACVRLHADVEQIVSSRMSQQRHSLLSIIYGMRSYLGFIYHELKNLADPLLNAIAIHFQNSPETSSVANLLSEVASQQQSAFKSKITGITFAKEVMAEPGREVGIACEELIGRYEAEMKAGGIVLEYSSFGNSKAVRLNTAILRMVLDSLLRDIILRHLRKRRSGVHIKVITVQTDALWAVHIGQNHGALMHLLADRLFWYPNPAANILAGKEPDRKYSANPAYAIEESLSTGVGAYYHGLFLRGLNLYPTASRTVPAALTSLDNNTLKKFRCWFSIYGRNNISY